MDIIKIVYESADGIFVQNRVMNREYIVKPSSHTNYELVYIVRGKVGLTINNNYVECQEGEVMMVETKTYHIQRMFEGVETELQVVECNPNLFPHFVKLDFSRANRAIPFGGNRIPLQDVKNAKLAGYFKKIVHLAKRRNLPYKDTLILSEILKLVAAINLLLDEKVQSGPLDREEDKRKRNLFEACINFINANVSRTINLDDIAAAVHFSKSYVQHVFKQKMGMSVSAYVNAQKMSIARSLLVNDESPMSVAQKLGFEYYTTFSVKFKQYYGVSPKDIKKTGFQINTDMEELDKVKELLSIKEKKE